MSFITIHYDKIREVSDFPSLCPFGAIVLEEGLPVITSGCRMCRLCIENGPEGVFELVEGSAKPMALTDWSGISVFIEISQGRVHPVSYEMIGKAKELANKAGCSVYAVAAADSIPEGLAEEIAQRGVDELSLYESPHLSEFRVEPYTAVLEDFITQVRPASFLIGGTPFGRLVAPRAAARFRTGLTADCTLLDINAQGELDQIRPAFGGNIMAHIKTPHHRPQFATVRYKIFNEPDGLSYETGTIIRRTLPGNISESGIEVLDVHPKERTALLEEAETIIAVGRGIKNRNNLLLAEKLAGYLQGEIGSTRPLVEEGWIDPRRQIGLSGRSVRPKLLITLGVSGSVQFSAGMNGAEKIIAVNTDAHAPIFSIAHVGIVGDAAAVTAELIDCIKRGENADEWV